MRRFLAWLTSLLPRPRVIHNMNGDSPYLTRWYLIGRPHMANGSEPFDEYGDPHPEAIWGNKRFGIYIHRFHRSDDDRELHNHPWRWSFSIVLAGGYDEERREPDGSVSIRCVSPWSINWIDHDTFHRVDLLEHDAWTLFVAGPKVSSWGFWNRLTGEFQHWRAFVDAYRAKQAAE